MTKTPSKINEGVTKTPSLANNQNNIRVEKPPNNPRKGVTKTPSIKPVNIETPRPGNNEMTKTPNKSNTKHTKKGKKKKQKLEKVRVIYCNANGIRVKIKSIETAALAQSAHVICITETRGPAPRIDGYSKWYEKVRDQSKGGGVAIAVRDDIANKCQPVDDIEDVDQEVKWAQITTQQNKNSL